MKTLNINRNFVRKFMAELIYYSVDGQKGRIYPKDPIVAETPEAINRLLEEKHKREVYLCFKKL